MKTRHIMPVVQRMRRFVKRWRAVEASASTARPKKKGITGVKHQQQEGRKPESSRLPENEPLTGTLDRACRSADMLFVLDAFFFLIDTNEYSSTVPQFLRMARPYRCIYSGPEGKKKTALRVALPYRCTHAHAAPTSLCASPWSTSYALSPSFPRHFLVSFVFSPQGRPAAFQIQSDLRHGMRFSVFWSLLWLFSRCGALYEGKAFCWLTFELYKRRREPR